MSNVTPLPQRAAHVPPQALEAEESVLGACMLSDRAIAAVSEIISPDGHDFYRESHGRIYRAALHLNAQGEPVDAITLVNELEQRGELEEIGGRARIGELAALVPATANAAHYARIVKEKATLRALIRAGAEIVRLGEEQDDETLALVDRAQQITFELSAQGRRGGLDLIAADVKDTFDVLVGMYERGEDTIGVQTGLRDLDKLTSGWQPGNLVILAARPSMGKSALAVTNLNRLSVDLGLPCAFFSLEMSKQEVTQRLLALRAKVDLFRFRNGRIDADAWPRLTKAADDVQKAPLYLDDTAVTVPEIRAKARALKARVPGLALVAVDYLQLMTSGSSQENRVQEVSEISRQLKLLAKELDVPVVALSQLSRAVEQRHDKRPILSDLRESGSIEQDADLVCFVYRDEYYNPESDAKGLAELIVAKHRNGPTDTVKAQWNATFARFSDLASVR